MSCNKCTPRYHHNHIHGEVNPPVDNCTFFKEHSNCAECDGGKKVYKRGECITVCREVDGQEIKFIHRVIVDETTDDPIMGAISRPPTWEVTTMCQVVNEVFRPICDKLADIPDNGNYIGG